MDNNIINALTNLQDDEDSSTSENTSLVDQDQVNDIDTGDNTMAAQVATTEAITGTASDNITADEKLDNEDNAQVLEGGTNVVHVNAAIDSAVVEEGEEQKALLDGPAILSDTLPLQQEVDEDKPSRPASRSNFHRRSSSADSALSKKRGDERALVPSEQLSSLPISANTLRDDRRAQRAHNKQKAEEMAQQQLDDRVRLGQEEAAFAL
jgi:hypothetical protein